MNKAIGPIKIEGRDRVACIDLSVYALPAVIKSAYRFTGRCFLHLQTLDPARVEVRIRPKDVSDDPDILVGEFFNDLLDQQLRSIVSAETLGVRDLILAHALSQTTFARPDLEDSLPQHE